MEELLNCTLGIHRQALNANSYWVLLNAFKKYYEIYKDEMNCTPAFWGMTYNAWSDSCFVLLAKLFDVSNDVVGIRKLREMVNDNIELFSDETISFPMREVDKKIFGKDVKVQNALFDILEIKEEKRKFYFDISRKNMIDIFSKKYCSMSKILDKLVRQRNKIMVHNDGDIAFDSAKLARVERVSLEDENILITYALDLTQVVYYSLKGEYLPVQYGNIEDIKILFEFMHDGYLKMKERDLSIVDMMMRGE